MASTYSDLKIELIGTGEQTGTWGSTTNSNFSIAVGEAITGSANVVFASADVTLTLTDTNGSQTARNLRLNLTGTSGGARNLILGAGCQIEKLYLINNGLADAVTVKNTAGTGIAVPAGKSLFVFNDGTNVVEAVNAVISMFVTGNASVGGNLAVTGTSTFTGASAFTADASFNSTGQIKVPVGTTAQRSGSPVDGMIRGSSTFNAFEGYINGAWGNIGGGATGGGGDTVFVENSMIVTTSYSIPIGKSASCVGPIQINSGAVVTVPANSRWVIL